MNKVWCVMNPDGTIRGIFKKERNAFNCVPAKARVSRREKNTEYWEVGKLSKYIVRSYYIPDYREL